MAYSLEYGVRGFTLPRKYNITRGSNLSFLPANVHLPALASIPGAATLKKGLAYGVVPVVGVASVLSVSMLDNPAPTQAPATTTPRTSQQAHLGPSKSATPPSPTTASPGSAASASGVVAGSTNTIPKTALDGISPVPAVSGSVGRGGGSADTLPAPSATPSVTVPDPTPPPAPTPPQAPLLSASVDTPVAQAGVDVIPPSL